MNTIFTRRSIRRFENKPVEKEKLERIVKAGMQAPSAHNRQPWEFLVITDTETKQAVGKMTPYSGMSAHAGAVIIILMNKKTGDIENNLFIQQDMGACTQNILLQIAEEGLGGCWIGTYPNENNVRNVKEYFKLPEHIEPFAIIALGYSSDSNRFVDRYDASKVHFWNNSLAPLVKGGN